MFEKPFHRKMIQDEGYFILKFSTKKWPGIFPSSSQEKHRARCLKNSNWVACPLAQKAQVELGLGRLLSLIHLLSLISKINEFRKCYKMTNYVLIFRA